MIYSVFAFCVQYSVETDNFQAIKFAKDLARSKIRFDL